MAYDQLKALVQSDVVACRRLLAPQRNHGTCAMIWTCHIYIDHVDQCIDQGAWHPLDAGCMHTLLLTVFTEKFFRDGACYQHAV